MKLIELNTICEQNGWVFNVRFDVLTVVTIKIVVSVT
jgi:hypothetical protein